MGKEGLVIGLDFYFNGMKILTISGSSRIQSANVQLLDCLPYLFSEAVFQRYAMLERLPLFQADNDKHPLPLAVLDWRKTLTQSDALIICTPEYLHNLPALLKNALEWVSSSGELAHKPVLAMTFTPHPPRGEKAMQSLLWSLQALNARIVAQLALYQNEITVDKHEIIAEAPILEMLREAIQLLG